jgi:protocatechuate 3,4-dioxygenase beta subunit/5-hydroxyisourate hydrolase-like protein (transthyretin family)
MGAVLATSVPLPTTAQAAAAGRIVGTVRDRQGKPLAKIKVTLTRMPPSGPGDQVSTTTDPAGRFACAGLSPGDYMVFLSSSDGRYPTVWARRVVTLAPGAKQTSVSYTLSPGALVTGRVYDKRTGAPVPGAEVSGGPAGKTADGKDTFTFLDSARADAAGRFRLRVAAGAVAIAADQEALGIKGDLKRLTAREGQTLVYDIAVVMNPVMTFIGPDGRPVAGARVDLHPEKLYGRSAFLVSETSDADGRVTLAYFQQGVFRARKGDLFASGTFAWAGAGGQMILRTPTETVGFNGGRITVRMSDTAPAYLTGAVTDETGAPLPGAVVRVSEVDLKTRYGRSDLFVRAGTNGRFRIPLALDGHYSLAVRTDGFGRVEVDAVRRFIPRLGETKDAGTVTLARAEGTISGRVVDDAGKGVSGMVVSAEGPKTGRSAALTDATGAFRIPNLVTGEALELQVYRGLLSEGDSGSPGRTSNDIWYRIGVRSGLSDLTIALRKEDIDKRLPAPATP